MKTKKLLTTIIKDDFYLEDFYLMIGDKEKASKYIAKEYTDILGIKSEMDSFDEYPKFYNLEIQDNGIRPIGFMYIPEILNTPDFYDQISHECTHRAICVLKWKGIDVDDNDSGQEILAYTVGWTMKAVIRQIQKWKELNKKKRSKI